MVEKSEGKLESLLNLDDLLQCPVCYEIPPGQIFQCNEGHHVCGGCKMRLDMCPVCRALFFGTRNYAMEELISNFRKMRSLKLSSKASGSGSSQSSTPAKENTSEERENNASDNEDDDGQNIINVLELNQRPPQPCSGLFRCLCCKTGSTARLPSARLLNHLRYFHSPDLIEGRSENGEYLQAWQFSTVPGKIVIAVRIADMGIFFLTIDISSGSLCAWLSMAASPWIAYGFSYTITICGNDREAIFSDSVWSVRSCEGTLKKRGHCLLVGGADALALTAPPTISGKLSVRRTPAHQVAAQTTPRAVLRVANRVNQNASGDLEPFLQELQNDVARLSREFATLDRQANALVLSGAQMRARFEHVEQVPEAPVPEAVTPASDSDAEMPPEPSQPDRTELSRNARKRLKQRMRAALDRPIPPDSSASSHFQNQPAQSRQNGPVTQQIQNIVTRPRQNNAHTSQVTQPTQGTSTAQVRQNASAAQPRQNVTQPTQTASAPPRQRNVNNARQNAQSRASSTGFHNDIHNGFDEMLNHIVSEQSAPVAPPPVASSSSAASQSQPQTSNGNRNKKKRRNRK